MSSLLYVTKKTVKNWILETIRHPGRLIIYLILAFIIVSSVISNMGLNTEDMEMGFTADISILHAVYFALLLITGCIVLSSALKSGTTVFTMSDVNMLFVSPISPKLILSFGLLKQMGAIVFAFIIFLLYGEMIRSIFNVTVAQAVVLIAGLLIFVLCCQITAMALYSLINGDIKRNRIIKAALYICVAAVPIIMGIRILSNGVTTDSVFGALKTPIAEIVPLFGWAKGLVFAIINLDILKICIFSVLMLALVGASLAYFLFCQPDYYEDVLQNTESTYEMRQAMKQGKVVDKRDFSNFRKIRVHKTGIGFGNGASAFFFKHLCEIKRRSRLMFLNTYSFVQTACGLFMAVIFTKIDAEDPIPATVALISIFAMSVYMQMFFSAAGEWGRELLKRYIYLVPDSPMKKLFFASLTSIIKPFFDGILTFGVLGIYLQAPPADAIMLIIAYTSCGAIFAGANILSERILNGISSSNPLMMLLYILMSILLLLPGTVVCIVTAVVFDVGLAAALIPMSVINILASVLLFVLSKNTIHNMETNL